MVSLLRQLLQVDVRCSGLKTESSQWEEFISFVIKLHLVLSNTHSNKNRVQLFPTLLMDWPWFL